jgi:hypothetical protein
VRGHGALIELTAPAELVQAAARAFAPTLSVEHRARGGDETGGPGDGGRLEPGQVDVARSWGPQASVVADPSARSVRSTSLGEVGATDADDLVRLTASVTQLELAAHARPEVFVHAGVVAHQGRAIVVPGSSHAGKTTLVRALVEAGATYYSDEYAVLDLHGNVAPFAKPLSIRTEGGGSASLDPRELGDVGTESVPVVLVAALQYRPGVEWRPTLQRGATTALVLVEHSVPARSRQVDTLDAAAAVARTAALVRGDRGPAEAAAVELLHLLASLDTSPWRWGSNLAP